MSHAHRADLHDRRTLDAADRLRETLKLVLTLREYEDVSLEEAAKLLGMAEDELQRLHAEALEQLEALAARDA
jgi:DNA-directed RNA polymerase specialized sigma subunit